VDANASGGSSLSLVNTSGSASLLVESNTDVAGATSSIEIRAESASATQDRKYRIETDEDEGDDLIITCETAANSIQESLRINPAGRISFACGGNPITNLNVSAFQVRLDAWFRDTLKVGGVCTFDESVNIGVAGDSKQLTLNGVQITASPAVPTFHHWVNFNKPATGYQLGSGSHIVNIGDGAAAEKSVTYYLTLPPSNTAVVGDYVEVRCLAQIHLQLETENTNILYAAVFDQMSNSKSITYSVFNDEFFGKITYVQHPQSTSQFSWVSTTGALY